MHFSLKSLPFPLPPFYQGLILTRGGVEMPSGNSPQWKSAFPHLDDACTNEDLVHVPARLDVAQMQKLMACLPSTPVATVPSAPPLVIYVDAAKQHEGLSVLVEIYAQLVKGSASEKSALSYYPSDSPVLTNMVVQVAESLVVSRKCNRVAVIIDNIPYLSPLMEQHFFWLEGLRSPNIQLVFICSSLSASTNAVRAVAANARILGFESFADDELLQLAKDMWPRETQGKVAVPADADLVRVMAAGNKFKSPAYVYLACVYARLSGAPLAAPAPDTVEALLDKIVALVEKQAGAAPVSLVLGLLSRARYPLPSAAFTTCLDTFNAKASTKVTDAQSAAAVAAVADAFGVKTKDSVSLPPLFALLLRDRCA